MLDENKDVFPDLTVAYPKAIQALYKQERTECQKVSSKKQISL